MKSIRIIFLVLINFILFSCSTTNIQNKKANLETDVTIYEYIDKNIMINRQSIILESKQKNLNPKDIRVLLKFGVDRNPINGNLIFRDYVAYPYYSINTFCSALDGQITKMQNFDTENHGSLITIKTENLEIEYFGWFYFNKDLKVGDKITKGTLLGTMYGGGDSGMVLHIRMKYKGKVLNPDVWFN